MCHMNHQVDWDETEMPVVTGTVNLKPGLQENIINEPICRFSRFKTAFYLILLPSPNAWISSCLFLPVFFIKDNYRDVL
jgi:hypothetical protein